MIATLLLSSPILGGLVLALRRRWFGRVSLLVAALVHSAVTAALWLPKFSSPASPWPRWIELDAAGLYFLSITSLLFAVSAVYGIGYLRRETEKFKISPWVESVFTACMLFFLFSMTLITVSQRFEILWVAVELTTLVSAPLIYFHRHQHSLEATWKYLIICSVGIALALLGTFFLSVAASRAGIGQHGVPMFLADLLGRASKLDKQWLKAAFIFLLVGYGTKMGLAPLHSWLPDAHSESPSFVSALLSGALLNCAFLAILRSYQVCHAAGIADFANSLLISFGVLSIAVAAVFIVKQTDYKRMLAYSSVEHMGILSVGIGLGGGAVFGGMLHAVNHSMTKAMLFLLSGNILAAYHSKSTRVVFGVSRVLPVTGILWVAGLLAITGTPPFGTFLSEFTILKAAFNNGHKVIAVILIVLLAIIFIGMTNIALKMAQGLPAESLRKTPHAEPYWSILPSALLGAGVLALGLYIPSFLNSRLIDLAKLFGGTP